jgi:hypothetical protein
MERCHWSEESVLSYISHRQRYTSPVQYENSRNYGKNLSSTSGPDELIAQRFFQNLVTCTVQNKEKDQESAYGSRRVGFCFGGSVQYSNYVLFIVGNAHALRHHKNQTPLK